MAPTAGHRSKRHNSSQPAITSFFGADAAARPGQTHDREVSSPALPPHVQSSLLNVGMRVRKSVPEGYKTKATDDDFTPEIISTPISSSSRSELQPFCGLHKTGGFASQPSDLPPTAAGVRPVGAYDALPSSAFSSQSVLGSQQSYDGDQMRALMPSAFGSSNKRGLDDDELDDETLLEDMEADTTDRVFAHPRGRGRSKGSGALAVPAGPGTADGGSDFGEAEFLRLGDEMEL